MFTQASSQLNSRKMRRGGARRVETALKALFLGQAITVSMETPPSYPLVEKDEEYTRCISGTRSILSLCTISTAVIDSRLDNSDLMHHLVQC